MTHLTTPQTIMYRPDTSSQSRNRHSLIALGVLAVVEILVFGVNYAKVGFYLDDWSMLSELTFGPKDWLALPAMYFYDPRVAIRPVEAIYFPWLYLLLGVKPLIWHVFNGVVETLGAWFLYLTLSRIRIWLLLALAGSVLFLINPCHDSTHYWITCSSATFSVTLYLMSLWQSVKAVQTNGILHRLYSAIAFALAVFNYESVMPLFIVNLWYVALVEWREGKKTGKVIKDTLGFSLLYLPTCALMVVYERLLLPAIKLGNYRLLAIEPFNMIKVVQEGFNCLLGPYGFSFLNQQAWAGMGLFQVETLITLLCLLTTTTVIGSVAVNLVQWRSKVEAAKYINSASFRQKITNYALALLFPGLLCMIVSYAVFGVAVIYHPTLLTTIDRINIGGTIGSTLCILFLIALLQTVLESLFRSVHISYLPVFLCIATLLTYFALADWGYSVSWIRSTAIQKIVRKALLKHRSEIPKSCNLILAGCPRYDMWAPVSDGVWDFEAMARIILNDPHLNANVVSDRLVFCGDTVKDISQGFLCGAYPLKGLRVLLVPTGELTIVNNAREFVKLIEPYYSRSQVPPKIFQRWKLSAQL